MKKYSSITQTCMTQIMDLLENHLGFDSEIIFQDLSQDYDCTIADIRNGHHSGRRVGDAGDRQIGMMISQGIDKNDDTYNYIIRTKSAHIFRSSNAYLRDSNGTLTAVFTINTNITHTLQFEHFMQTYNNPTKDSHPNNDLTECVPEVLERYLLEAESAIGVPVAKMNKSEKGIFLLYLDSVKAFRITNSPNRISEFLGISRAAMYEILKNAKQDAKEKMAYSQY